MDTQAPVLVGVDGSESAVRAARFAAREAALRHRPLRIVHAFAWPVMQAPMGLAPAVPPEDEIRRYTKEIVDEAAAAAAATAPQVPVTAQVIDGAAAPVLLAESRTAALVVLGDQGFGPISGALIGSVASQVATHAECPVLVARGSGAEDGPVIVGVDGSELSERAVDFAAEAASLRGADLLAVHTWTHPPSIGPGDMQPLVYDAAALRAEEEAVLAESVAGLRERHPELAVRQLSVEGRATKVLVDESSRGQLLVVGARGRGGFTGLLLGSVSNALLYRSDCPLAIVRVAKDKD
ncbi:universal stress protein [Solwaraspora sp. WMMA2056]|uniref:universal stress protein n=1 Tax=Solwaraspora sp. WMMA2056 TaxID=3015161 RepID=UPI00259BA236|nr:universal stress protein [Solwaraspora sp. WMMA2056]WJK39687.1 universal stress protein [Solwaraspora sp. WMMA2056]